MLSRRTFLGFAASVAVFAAQADSRLKVVVAGGHPGDPECGCGGTIAKYTAAGHDVVLLYMNRGEGYCDGHDPSTCGAVRTAEAQKACSILKAHPAFAGQYDGRAIVDNAHYDDFEKLLAAEKPDILFAQWPLDKHRDHRAMSALLLDAWMKDGKKSALYFYEVFDDTMMFSPDEFVDMAAVEPLKRAACYAHASQLPDRWYPEQKELGEVRGAQVGMQQAEAFLRHWESKPGWLP